MIIKLFEIRDRATFIPCFAFSTISINVKQDYLGLASTAGTYGLYATKKDAIETADHIKAFLEGSK